MSSPNGTTRRCALSGTAVGLRPSKPPGSRSSARSQTDPLPSTWRGTGILRRHSLVQLMTSGGAQDILVCPETKLPVRQRALDEATSLTPERSLVAGRSDGPRPVGPTPSVLLREDHQCAYPVVDGIPVLLAPEALVPPSRQRSVDLSDPRYAEAYAEMDFYNQV